MISTLVFTAASSGSDAATAPGAATLTVHALYISPNDDCSAMQLVQDDGSVGVPKDMMSAGGPSFHQAHG